MLALNIMELLVGCQYFGRVFSEPSAAVQGKQMYRLFCSKYLGSSMGPVKSSSSRELGVRSSKAGDQGV
ncbi:hypothetical protein VFPPC_15128 [Pochonia chlamydosporia 170]|uniref:Uncharacterized protein n=1 Tax=Pochonia chlamydosporia 170 TaxID=1380566 RepID=A0A179G3I4_METCM|nr:hypothetical protein VFPPC_15128 [Pochonia chlamydosporia 170]OAQ72432.1 hypothetical protein VFPPC_15128 [Pochonia chlamydosporia 170]